MTVWERRDLPVLRALATSADRNLQHGFLHIGPHGGNALDVDLSAGELHDAILALADVDYVEGKVEYETGPGALFTRLQVTGRGQQALGQWPLFDQIASPDTLALFLEQLADEAETDEEASHLRRAAAYARSLSVATVKAAAIGAASHVARTALGFG